MLSSFEIQGFRTFAKMRIETFGHVNLIVGRNNTGKSSLLEALRLFAGEGHQGILKDILQRRDEIVLDSDSSEQSVQLAALFHGRLLNPSIGPMIQLGPVGNSAEVLRIRPVFLQMAKSEDDLFPSRWEEIAGTGSVDVNDPKIQTGLSIERNGAARLMPVEYFSARRAGPRNRDLGPTCVWSTGVDSNEAALWWDMIALTDVEERVIESLNLFAPVDRITLVKHPSGLNRRLFMVRLKGERSPAPLKSFGDGMSRMFHIALALEHSRRPRGVAQMSLFTANPGDTPSSTPAWPVLLIDEAENGIHYTLHTQIWRFIFRVAALHGVQIFATSHSWDCVLGFQVAASEAQNTAGVLVRIEQKAGISRAITFEENELEIVTRDCIEVR